MTEAANSATTTARAAARRSGRSSGTTRPLYFRALRIRHLRVRPWVVFLLFEGSFVLAILLAFAEIVDWWGVLIIPAVVAIMVKVNDMVAAAMLEPLAEAQLRTPGVVPRRATGWSSVPRTGRLTTEIADDDAVADPEARPDGIARGVARPYPPGVVVPSLRRPMPGVRSPEPPLSDLGPVETFVTHLAGPTRPDGVRVDGSNGRESPERRSRGNQGRFAD